MKVCLKTKRFNPETDKKPYSQFIGSTGLPLTITVK